MWAFPTQYKPFYGIIAMFSHTDITGPGEWNEGRRAAFAVILQISYSHFFIIAEHTEENIGDKMGQQQSIE